jgi:hypothetical protein
MYFLMFVEFFRFFPIFSEAMFSGPCRVFPLGIKLSTLFRLTNRIINTTACVKIYEKNPTSSVATSIASLQIEEI